MEFLQNLLYAIITAAVPVLTVYICRFMQALYENKKNQIKNDNIREVLGQVTDMIAAAVETTTSTYVRQLKADNLFDKEAQKKAFNMTYNAVKSQLTTESSAIIEQVYGDVNLYITNQIESMIENSKK